MTSRRFNPNGSKRSRTSSNQTGLDEFHSLLQHVVQYMKEHDEYKSKCRKLWDCLKEILPAVDRKNISNQENKEEEASEISNESDVLREQQPIHKKAKNVVSCAIITKNAKKAGLNLNAAEFVPKKPTFVRHKKLETALSVVEEKEEEEEEDFCLDDLNVTLAQHNFTEPPDEEPTLEASSYHDAVGLNEIQRPWVELNDESLSDERDEDEKSMELSTTQRVNRNQSQKSSRKTPVASPPTKSNRSSNFKCYVSNEMCECANDMNQKQLFDSTELCKSDIRATWIMQVNDAQVDEGDIKQTRQEPIAFFNLDMESFYGNEEMYGVVGENAKGYSERWRLINIMTKSQICTIYNVDPGQLPLSSRKMPWYKKGLRNPPPHNIPADILNKTNFVRLHVKYTDTREDGRGSISKPADRLMIQQNNFKRSLRESEHRFLPVIKCTSAANINVEWIKFVKVYDKEGHEARVAVALRYHEAQKRFAIECIHCDAIRVYRQYRLVRLEANYYYYDRDYFKKNITGSVEIIN